MTTNKPPAFTCDGCGKDADRHGEIEGRSLFADVRRGEVDRDLLIREKEVGVFDRRLDPFACLADGAIGETDSDEVGKLR